MKRPRSLERLVKALSRLPGIGPRSASRMALRLIRSDGSIARELSDALLGIGNVRPCGTCGALAEGEDCPLCSDPGRDRDRICVVDDPSDVWILERSGRYRGLYHVLPCLISPIEGRGISDLALERLERRLGGVKEVILALDGTAEGRATSLVIRERFAGKGTKITSIARGLPVGADLSFADELTLGEAIENRREIG